VGVTGEEAEQVPSDEPLARQAGPGRPELSLGRLARGAEIRHTLRNGRNYASEAGNARILEGTSGQHRLCVITSRQVGKAHVRNRVRRVVREILRREMRLSAAPVDLVFRAKPAAETMGFWELHRALLGILRKAHLDLPPAPDRWGASGGDRSDG
jgi:ribonuclease P protein component